MPKRTIGEFIHRPLRDPHNHSACNAGNRAWSCETEGGGSILQHSWHRKHPVDSSSCDQHSRARYQTYHRVELSSPKNASGNRSTHSCQYQTVLSGWRKAEPRHTLMSWSLFVLLFQGKQSSNRRYCVLYAASCHCSSVSLSTRLDQRRLIRALRIFRTFLFT